MMRSEEILEALAEVDARFPTDRWRVGGLRALPLFRYELYNGNHTLHHRPGRSSSKPRRIDAIRAKASAAARLVRAEVLDRSARAKIERVDALLFSDGVSFAELSGRYYERFCDPLRERLSRLGLTSLLATPLDAYAFPRHSPSVFVQPAIEVARVRAVLDGRLRRPQVDLPQFDEVCSFLEQRYPGIVVPTSTRLWRIVASIEAFASMYSILLRRTLPRVVYLVCFYGSERFAMLLAAHRLGIRTVDIQHGYSGDLHWAYARWSKMPAGGYDLLPRYFWCWSDDERRTMSDWADRSGGAHRVLVGGNLFANMWREGGSALVYRYDTEVRAELARHVGRVAVLYAANGLETDEQLCRLARVIRATAGEMFWYYRLHPCRSPDAQRVAEIFAREGASTIEISQATKLPLYALLRHVSLHVTESSTTVIEASDFGVPSVLHGTVEAPSFAQYVASGWLRIAEHSDDLPGALRYQLAQRDELRRGRPGVLSPAGLDELLELACPPPGGQSRDEMRHADAS